MNNEIKRPDPDEHSARRTITSGNICFNPRAPRGARQLNTSLVVRRSLFQSTQGNCMNVFVI